MENSEQKSFWRLFFFSTPKLSTSLIRCQCAWKTCLHKSTNTHEQTHIYIHCLWHIWRPFLWAPKSTHQFYLSEMKKIDSQKKNGHITRKDCVHKLKHTYIYTVSHDCVCMWVDMSFRTIDAFLIEQFGCRSLLLPTFLPPIYSFGNKFS